MKASELERKLREAIEALNDPDVTATEEGPGVRIAERLLFDSGRATIKKEGKVLLQKVAKILKDEFGDAYIRIDGHTDSDPITKSRVLWKTASNFELSAHRALNVLLAFKSMGVPASQMYLAAFSQFRPVTTPEKSEADKQANRRVEIFAIPR